MPSLTGLDRNELLVLYGDRMRSGNDRIVAVKTHKRAYINVTLSSGERARRVFNLTSKFRSFDNRRKAGFAILWRK